MSFREITKIVSTSSVKTICFDYEVSLHNFTTRGECFSTQESSPPNNKQFLFCLSVYPKQNTNVGDKFSVYLVLKSMKPLKGTASCYLQEKNGDKWNKQGN